MPVDVADYRSALPPDQLATFDQLAALARAVTPSLQAAIKWRVPTFTVNGNWHHWLFRLASTKNGLSLTFHKGWLLADPQRVLQGAGPHLRQILFTGPEQLRPDVIAALMREAIRHQLEME